MSSDIASIWSLVTVLGPILFLAVLAWVIMRNKSRSRTEHDRPNRTSNDLHVRLGRENKARDARK